MPDQEEIQQLQKLEQNLSNISSSKQSIQTQIMELESALKELKNQTQAYKIIGNVMVQANAAKLKEDLSEKKSLYELRIKTIEKQENQLKEKSKELQAKVMKQIQDEQNASESNK